MSKAESSAPRVKRRSYYVVSPKASEKSNLGRKKLTISEFLKRNADGPSTTKSKSENFGFFKSKFKTPSEDASGADTSQRDATSQVVYADINHAPPSAPAAKSARLGLNAGPVSHSSAHTTDFFKNLPDSPKYVLKSQYASSNNSHVYDEVNDKRTDSEDFVPPPPPPSKAHLSHSDIYEEPIMKRPSTETHSYYEENNDASSSSHVYEELDWPPANKPLLEDDEEEDEVQSASGTYINPMYESRNIEAPMTAVLLYGGRRIIDDLTGNVTETSNLYRLNLRNGEMDIATDDVNGLPSAKTKQAAAVLLDGDVYIVGGLDPEETSTNAVPTAISWRLQDVQDGNPRWTRIADLNTARVHHSLIVLRGRHLMAIGGLGRNNRILDSIEKYEPGHNMWKELKSTIPQPCLGMAACVHRGLMWLLGGITPYSDGKQSKQGRVSDTVYVFNDTLDAWYWGPPLRSPRTFARAIVARNQIHIIGGIGWASFKFGFEAVDYLDTVHNKWLLNSNLRNMRHHFALVKQGDELYVIGGVSTDTNAELSSIEKLNFNAKKWTTLEYALPNPFFGTECV